MSLRVALPKPITDATLVSCSVPELAPALYSGGTSYGLDELAGVADGTAIDVYESLQAGNTGHSPAASPAWWRLVARTYEAHDDEGSYATGDIVIDPVAHVAYESQVDANTAPLSDATKWVSLGPTNRWRMFDGRNATKTEANGFIEFDLLIGDRVDTIGLLDVSGTHVTIVGTVGGVERFRREINLLRTPPVADYYSYVFNERFYRRYVPVIFPPYAGLTLHVLIEGSAVSIANFVVGRSRVLGGIEFGAQLGLVDLNKYTENPITGEETVTVRPSARTADYAVHIMGDTAEQQQSKFDAAYEQLDDMRGKLALWIGSENYGSTMLYGRYRTFTMEISFAKEAIARLSLRGAT